MVQVELDSDSLIMVFDPILSIKHILVISILYPLHAMAMSCHIINLFKCVWCYLWMWL